MKKLYMLVAFVLSGFDAVDGLRCAGRPSSRGNWGFKVGQVTDLGGVDDKSFNASAWKGVQDAISHLGVDGKYLESKDQSDYAKNIQQFLSEGDKLIVTIGFLLGVDTAKAAKANPNVNFAIVDYTFPDCYPGAVEGKDCGSSTDIPNVRGIAFQTDQAAFLAGYAAAGMSKTGNRWDVRRHQDPDRDHLHEGHGGGHQVLQPAEERQRQAARLGHSQGRRAVHRQLRLHG